MKRNIKRIWIRFHSKYLESKKLTFIHWFFNRNPEKYCWADCVGWVYDSSAFNPYKIGTACKGGIDGVGACYCGEWDNGICWHTLPQAERDRIKSEAESNIEHDPIF